MYFEHLDQRKQLYKDLDYSNQQWLALEGLSHALLVMVDYNNGHTFLPSLCLCPYNAIHLPIKRWCIFLYLLNLCRSCDLLWPKGQKQM